MDVRRTRLGLVAVAMVAGALALAACAGSDDGAPVAGGTRMSASPGRHAQVVEQSFEMMDAGRRSFADYGGTPLVVNFFASWCGPCLAEMPAFEGVHRELVDEVAFLGLNLQDPPDAGRAVVEQTGVTYDIGRDPDGDLFQSLGGLAMPTTVFIDAAGSIVHHHSGVISAADLRARIDEELLGTG